MADTEEEVVVPVEETVETETVEVEMTPDNAETPVETVAE